MAGTLRIRWGVLVVVCVVAVILVYLYYLLVLSFYNGAGPPPPSTIKFSIVSKHDLTCASGNISSDMLAITVSHPVQSPINTNTTGFLLHTDPGVRTPLTTPGSWTGAGTPCPRAGWWATLSNSSGGVLAYWTLAGNSSFWVQSPTATQPVSPPINIVAGQFVEVYLTGVSPTTLGGNYTLDVTGLGQNSMDGGIVF